MGHESGTKWEVRLAENQRSKSAEESKRREVWKSLKTTVLTVAKLKLIDEQASIEHQRQSESALEGRHGTE